MSRFYKTTKTPTVDYAYVYPFEELFKAMKYKQDRHDKALETLQAGYDDFLNLKYRPADGPRVANIREQAENFIQNASNMPLHNAQGYIQQGINGIMNTQEVKDIATNYDNWIVQEQAKQQLQANEQWTPESQNIFSDTPTSEIPGNINSMMHTPKTNWRDDAEQYFNNMKLPYQNSAGVRAEARAGAPSFVASGPGYNALVDTHGQQNIDGLYAKAKQGDQTATATLNKYAEDILYATGREIYDIPETEEVKINSGNGGIPENYAESLYNKQIGAVITGKNGAKLNAENIKVVSGGTDSKFDNPNAFQITPQNITSYNELQGNNYYTWDPETKTHTLTTANSDQIADANLQSLQIQQLKAFKDSPYYTFYQNQVDAEEKRIKTLTMPGIQRIVSQMEEMRAGTKWQQNGIYVSNSILKNLYPESTHTYGVRIKPEDIAEGGQYHDFFTRYNTALTPTFGKGSITATNAIINQNVGNVAGVEDYNAQIRSLRNIGIVNPFDEKWTNLITQYDNDNEGEGTDASKARKTFNTVLRNNGTSLDFVPDANSNVTTRMVLGDDGEPQMVMVVKGNYVAGHNDLNNIFKKSNGFDQDFSMTDSQALGNMGSGSWGDTWWEVFGDENDGDFVTGLITRSDLTHKMSDGSGGVKTYPLFEIPATIEIPIDENTAPDYNKQLGQYKTGQVAELTPYWAEQFDAILMSNIAQNEIDFDKAQGSSRVTSINANFTGLIQEPDMTEYDATTGTYTDRRHTYLDNWYNDADLGLMTHLNEAFPNKGLIYNEMSDILSELKGDIDAHINGQGNKADLQASLHSLSTIYAAMNPSYFDEGVYLTPNAKQEKFRQFVNLMDAGGDASAGAYGLDNTNSNADIGITNGEITDKTKLRSSSRQYATKNNLIEFDQSKYSNINTSEMYAPFVSSNTEKAIEYLNTLELGGKLTITGLMRLPGYDKIIGKSAHPGHGLHTEGRACDLRLGTASDNLFLTWNTAAGRNQMITNGIVNMIKEGDHYHVEFAK